MATHDYLDPLGTDWDMRGKRGQAVLRERAYEESCGQLIPLEPLCLVLSELAGSVSCILQSIPERLRGLGLSAEAVTVAGEVVSDCCLQIAVSLDSAAEQAMGAVNEMESAMLGESVEADPGSAIAGPKERAKRTHTGKPHIGNAKAKAPKAPGKRR